LHLTNGKKFTVEALNFNENNIYQEQAQLNNSLLSKPWITYAEIMSGGKLTFQMTNH
jgi:putative alpha-1,2-mannosidase